MARQIVLDTETTGIGTEHGHRIIEIGCVELLNRKVTSSRFHTYLNPEREVEAGAFAVHGISSESLKDKPFFADILQDFIKFIDGAELIIHNAPFDVGFLNHELKLAKHATPSINAYCRVLDTLPLARKLHGGMRNNLDALCKRYGVDNQHREFHGALLDAHLLAQVYLGLTEGQRSLLDELDRAQQVGQHQVVAKIDTQRVPVVVRATSEEQRVHDDYLQQMLKQGKCLWSD